MTTSEIKIEQLPTFVEIKAPLSPLTVSSMVLAHVRRAQIEDTPVNHTEAEIFFALRELLEEHFLGQTLTLYVKKQIEDYVSFYFPVKNKPRLFIHEDRINITPTGIMGAREYKFKLARRQELCDELSTLNAEIATFEALDQKRRWNLSID